MPTPGVLPPAMEGRSPPVPTNPLPLRPAWPSGPARMSSACSQAATSRKRRRGWLALSVRASRSPVRAQAEHGHEDGAWCFHRRDTLRLGARFLAVRALLHASAFPPHVLHQHMAQMAARGRRRYELRVEMRGAAASKSELRGVQLLSNEVPSLATAHSEVAPRRPLWEWAALRTLPDRAFTAGAHRARAEAHRDLIGACRRAARAAPRRAIAQRCMTMRCRRIRRSMTGSERCVGVAQGSQTAMRHSTFTTLRRRAGRAAAPRSHGAPL